MLRWLTVESSRATHGPAQGGDAWRVQRESGRANVRRGCGGRETDGKLTLLPEGCIIQWFTNRQLSSIDKTTTRTCVCSNEPDTCVSPVCVCLCVRGRVRGIVYVVPAVPLLTCFVSCLLPSLVPSLIPPGPLPGPPWCPLWSLTQRAGTRAVRPASERPQYGARLQSARI